MEDAWAKKQAAMSPTGPGQVDFYRLVSGSQGSLGIVTWVSVRCEVLPEFHKLFFVPAQRLDDLIDFTYEILKFRFGDELLILNNFSLAAILGDKPARIKELRAKLPPWVVLVGIAGRNILPRERVEYQEKDISDIARKFSLRLVSAIPEANGNDILKTLLNTSREPYWKLDYKGGTQDIFFLTTLNRTPEFVNIMSSVAEEHKYPKSDVGIYIQPLHQGANCHCEFILPFDRDNPGEVTGIQQLFTTASERFLKEGAFYSRPYGIWGDMAYKQDTPSTAVLRKLKKIFDPNNIMNPDKLCF
jgi:FAD/FMN-containing dehydrogenase